MRHIMTPDLARKIDAARAAILRRGHDVLMPVGIGGSCPPASSVDRNCYRGHQPICDMQKLGSLEANIQPQAAFSLLVKPNKSQYFEPKAVRNYAIDNVDPDTNRRLFITSVSINGFPQEATDEQAPTVATTDGWWSDDWEAPDGCACPVGWGIFSVEALTKALKIAGFSRYPTGGAVCQYGMTVYGNAFDSLPPGLNGRPWEPRHSGTPTPQ